MNPEEQKKQAALKSLEFIDDDCILGVGTGSTVNHLISALPSVKNKIDAVIISGGAFDIDPQFYGQTQQARIDRLEPTRTELELALSRVCIEKNIPVLGICGGMQAMAVAMGGTLIQDISTQIPHALEHEQISCYSSGLGRAVVMITNWN